MKSRLFRALLCGAGLGLALPAPAEILFPVNNQGALARAFALPVLGQSDTPAVGQQEWRLALDWTNEYINEKSPSGEESLIEDGETQRLALAWRRGISPDFEINAELPVLVTGGGILDSTMQSWHHFFGLPNGGREQVPNGQYHYQYDRNGQTALNVDTATAGIGDITLGAGWQALPGLALRAMAKLPSGDAGKLLGGNAGGALWADYDPFAGSHRWVGFLSAGASFDADSDTLGTQQHRTVALVGTGIGYRFFSRWMALAQLYGHSQLYRDSDLQPFRRNALQLTLGGRYELSSGRALTFGFQEDPVTDSSPDFSMHFDWRFR